MPNWCFNTLEVSGPEDDIEKFYNKGNKDGCVLSLNSFIPYPLNYAELDRVAHLKWSKGQHNFPDAYNAFNGIGWCRNNWDTKWDLHQVSVDRRKGKLCYTFDTAWSPPLTALFYISLQFPTLLFYINYFEEGESYKGAYEVKNGEVHTDQFTTGEDE